MHDDGADDDLRVLIVDMAAIGADQPFAVVAIGDAALEPLHGGNVTPEPSRRNANARIVTRI
jgi:hypothetical protein